MNSSIHFSTDDGWHHEFARHGVNAFTIDSNAVESCTEEQDSEDNARMMDILEEEIIPLYYDAPKKWVEIMRNAMHDVIPKLSSARMAHEYYIKMYGQTNRKTFRSKKPHLSS